MWENSRANQEGRPFIGILVRYQKYICYNAARNNVCLSLAVTIQEKTKELRNQQKSFIEHRQNLEKSTKVSFLELAA